MSMSTHIVGIKPPDEKWKKMKAAWDACEAADVEPSKELRDFFGDEDPDEKGVVVEIEKTKAVSEYYEGEGRYGFEVDIAKLPKDVKIIRFYNSY